MARGASIPAYAALETYSVLTRLPPPIQVDGAVAAELLARAFGRRMLPFPPERQQGLIADLGDLAITGGAVYDALIALTVLKAGEELVTLDARALATYERCGVRARLLGE